MWPGRQRLSPPYCGTVQEGWFSTLPFQIRQLKHCPLCLSGWATRPWKRTERARATVCLCVCPGSTTSCLSGPHPFLSPPAVFVKTLIPPAPTTAEATAREWLKQSSSHNSLPILLDHLFDICDRLIRLLQGWYRYRLLVFKLTNIWHLETIFICSKNVILMSECFMVFLNGT